MSTDTPLPHDAWGVPEQADPVGDAGPSEPSNSPAGRPLLSITPPAQPPAYQHQPWGAPSPPPFDQPSSAPNGSAGQPWADPSAPAVGQPWPAPSAAAGGQEWPAPTPTGVPRPVATAPSFPQQNRGTLTVLALVLGYIVLASTTGIVLLGIAPAMMAVNVYQRKEPLRWLAVAAAGLALLMAFSGLRL